MTSMWSETKPTGTITTAGTPVAGERLEVVVDVRLQPRHVRRPEREQKTSVVRVRRPVSSATRAATSAATSRCWAT